MGMEEYIDTIELKQMKEQIAILNSKLDAEVVVNEKLLRKVIKNKVSGMNRYVGIMNSLALLLIPFFVWSCPYLGISWWFCSVFCLFLFIAVMHGYFTHKRLRTNDLMSEDLLVVARKLMEIKSLYLVSIKKKLANTQLKSEIREDLSLTKEKVSNMLMKLLDVKLVRLVRNN